MIDETLQQRVLSAVPGRFFEVALAYIYRAILNTGLSAIDGGANSGLHSIGMAYSMGGGPGRVFSVEP